MHETEHDVSSTTHTVNNDHVTVTVNRKPHCQVKFEIKIKPEAVQASYHQALKNINKEVSIPGFRKGRAPDSFLQDRYSSVIQKEFVEIVLNTGFHEALQMTHLHPLKESIKKRPIVHECSREKGAHFTIEFESRPLVPSVKVEELAIKKITPVTITAQDCENSLNNLVLQFAKYEPIHDRPVQEEDFVDVSLTILEDPPREVIHNQRTQVNATGLPIWIRQKVLGLHVGESAEGMTEQDQALVDHDPDFRSLPFRVTVQAIWQGILPAVDEELAKRVGVSSVEELSSKIKERLDQEAEREAYELMVQQIDRLLVEKYPIDLPQSYIDSDKEAHLNHYREQMEEEGKEVEDQHLSEIERAIERRVIYQLQLVLLFNKVAADYGIEVTQEDLSQELAHQLVLMRSNRCDIDFSSDREKQLKQLRDLAFDRKMKRFFVEHVKIEE